MLGVIGMRKMRPGAGIIRRRLDPRFRTGGGPPARSILFQLTHFDAAHPSVRSTALAVAFALAGGGRHAGSICGKSKCRGQQAEACEGQPESGEATCANPGGGPEHAGILRRLRRKTYGTG